VQLTLSIVSGIVLLFSVAFTPQDKNSVTLYLTVFGVLCGLVSTFWAYGYTRLSKNIRKYMEFREGKRPNDKVRGGEREEKEVEMARGPHRALAAFPTPMAKPFLVVVVSLFSFNRLLCISSRFPAVLISSFLSLYICTSPCRR
jgi:hypothetical protein